MTAHRNYKAFRLLLTSNYSNFIPLLEDFWCVIKLEFPRFIERFTASLFRKVFPPTRTSWMLRNLRIMILLNFRHCSLMGLLFNKRFFFISRADYVWFSEALFIDLLNQKWKSEWNATFILSTLPKKKYGVPLFWIIWNWFETIN